ncbi:MAG: dTMP kinase [Alphaproteobacteria bacterium]|nr:dTMP kinase [Alphaproteobacteria bacterium]NCB49100.1 dTMP kinase [Alphaproteobacteria bacterium]
MNGYFITIEGPDGGGKSTQAKRLTAFLKEKGKEVILTREPGGSLGAEEIRTLLKSGDSGKWDSFSETLLFMAARRDHLVKTIFPALKEGKWIVCDRFQDSTRAYQGAGAKKDTLSLKDIDSLYRLIAGDFKPDLTFILDLPVEVGLERALKRAGIKDRFESKPLKFHQDLRKTYLEIAKKETDRCFVVDASQTEDVVFEDMISHLKERFDV